MPNFLCVALALHELGYKPVGIRLDSGDLSYLSKQARVAFKATAERYGIEYFKKLNITASNDINEAVLNSLNEQVRVSHFGAVISTPACSQRSDTYSLML